MSTFRRPLIAIAAACMTLPLAACYDDGYGPDRGYGPPPPPPPGGGYYRDAPPPGGGDYGHYPNGTPRPPGDYRQDYREAPPPPADWRNYDEGHPAPGQDGYYADRYYRDEPGQERALTRDDRVYRGQDGRYYCRRSDGTTGLIVGALAGGILGNIIDGGHSRALGTLLGAGGGALVGKSVDEGQVRCR
jgi:hypothetical protein